MASNIIIPGGKDPRNEQPDFDPEAKNVFKFADSNMWGTCYVCGKEAHFLAGASHSPFDGNSHYVCLDHIDNDAVVVEAVE